MYANLENEEEELANLLSVGGQTNLSSTQR